MTTRPKVDRSPKCWHRLLIDPSRQPTKFEVGCELTFEVADSAALALQVAVASTAGALEVEDVSVALDGRDLDVEEVAVDLGGRVHLVRCGAGQLTVRYRAVVQRDAPVHQDLSQSDVLVALRPSRYCPSDVLYALADRELALLPEGPERGRAVGSWVFDRLRYELGSSGPLDTAVDTLLAGEGVCRDFAHLTVALCRAIGIPARLVSVYAPGISPMDFHAVAEVAADGRWEIVDATRLAPRQSLVRIATGRDAADTAFATTIEGSVELVASNVFATIDGDLPRDDHSAAVTL